jgi:hypothetical protein
VSGLEPAIGRVVAMVPAALLVLFTGLLVLLALPCDKQRRAYALAASAVAMGALAALWGTPTGRPGAPVSGHHRAVIHDAAGDPLHPYATSHEAIQVLPDPAEEAIDLLEALNSRPPIPRANDEP